ncbi:MAG TPA: sialate O-acetylesterase [Candidatus Bacteroides pullicola]|uniref:Sialate O-acetylesterase n=1 Tax=Candidatus Bacteroides pullicola TaxID=2838475 RepID=A0A9D2CLL6_9BACE|nr:sialate O-acetylesterase [Candidatus Bacteroides pullicola]
MKKLLFTLFLLLGVLTLGAKVKLPALVGDNMLLQQQTDVRLWGWAEPGATVRVTPSWDGQTVSCQADAQGRWLVSVKTPAASYTPYDITIDDGEPLTLKGVLVGEVWLASGQSNMQMPLKGFGGCCVKNGVDEVIRSADYPAIRFFTVSTEQAYEPQEDCKGRWEVPSVHTAAEFSATAWFFATSLEKALRVPVGIIVSAYGGSKVESWLSREILEGYPDVDLSREAIERCDPPYERPLLMYNAMIWPIRNYTFKGIIWYQGESNVGAHQTYARRLATMVDLWRDNFGLGEIPFYFVEIAPYDYDSPVQDGKGAYLREAQFKAQALIPNSAMVSTNDAVETYERHNIHPRNKDVVGHRLSYLALNLTYGMKQINCFGPQYKLWQAKGNEAWVAFDNLQMGICRNYDLRGFEVAGEDRVFYPADKVWLHWQTNEMVISSEKVAHPVAVRYGFGDFLPGTMIGGNELPTIPFRTDDWE